MTSGSLQPGAYLNQTRREKLGLTMLADAILRHRARKLVKTGQPGDGSAEWFCGRVDVSGLAAVYAVEVCGRGMRATSLVVIQKRYSRIHWTSLAGSDAVHRQP